ncbi:hypothetical protein Tco_1222527, partial [Tanacetum coccineum]
HAEKIARNENPLALVAAAQQYPDPCYQAQIICTTIKTIIFTRSHKDKEMQKILALIAKYFKKIYKPTNNLRTSSNTKNKNVDTTPRYKNDNQTGQFRNQGTMTIVGAKETVVEKGVPLQAEQSDCLADTDE